jgi:transposase
MEALLAAKFEVVLPHLDERQRRLLLGAEARVLGHGGIRLVAKASGMAESTVSRGVSEVEVGGQPLGRVRRAGGGRKRLTETNPGLVQALLALVEPDMRGDPCSPLRWTTKSTRNLAQQLTRQGHRVGADTVADLLRGEGFSLQSNAKTVEGKQHPDRDAQFRYLNEQARSHQQAGQPVISVDTKKKELVGLFANGGREWEPAGQPVKVSTHDFADKQLGKAVPYGIYDLSANTGWVNVGTDGDTATFAVESIRRWWHHLGKHDYPQAAQLLITADAGGSNGYKLRAWKTELAALAAETGLQVTVCHLPPGTSKWNKIEHRLFSHITLNWRGRPLTSHEVIVQTIAATTTRTGLKVHAQLDPGAYPTGIRISDAQMAALPITRHGFHGDWNYTLHPSQAAAGHAGTGSDQNLPAKWDTTAMSHPSLTGMATHQLDTLTAALEALHHNEIQERQRQRRIAAGKKPHAPRPGRPAKLTFPNRVLATIMHLRLSVPDDNLATMFSISGSAMHRAIRDTRNLLHQHGTVIEPITPSAPLADLLRKATETTKRTNHTTKIKPAC